MDNRELENSEIPNNEKNKNNFESLNDKLEIGVCIHAVDYLFSQIDFFSDRNFFIKISYLEIYNEQVIDLLVEKSSLLMIVEDAIKGVVVPDLSEISVRNSSELIKLIIEGNERRTMAATGQNLFSSRSHAILQIIVEQKPKLRDLKEEHLISKFLLVDLAGSERGGLEKGIRTNEGKNINKSLLSLGNCINILSDKTKKGAFVPYRDSKLTRLLKDSLGGNIKTVMIACISPSPTSYDETVNTLKYAMRARKIEKKITKNIKDVDVHISQYKEIIDSLKGEIEQLKNVIKEQEAIIKGTNSDVNNLQENYIKINFNENIKIINEKDNENLTDDIKENLSNNSISKRLSNKEGFKFNQNQSQIFKIEENISRINNLDEQILKISLISQEKNNLKKLTIYDLQNNELSPEKINNVSIGNTLISHKNCDITNDKLNSDSKIKFPLNSNYEFSRNLDKDSKINNNVLSKKLSFASIRKIHQNSKLKDLNDTKSNNLTRKVVGEFDINELDKLRNSTLSPNKSIKGKDLDISNYRSFLFKNEDEEYNLEELEKKVEK